MYFLLKYFFFCKPGVIQGSILNFNFCLVNFFKGRHLSRIKFNFFKKHSYEKFMLFWFNDISPILSQIESRIKLYWLKLFQSLSLPLGDYLKEAKTTRFILGWVCLTKRCYYIFSVSLKFRAYCITAQRDKFIKKYYWMVSIPFFGISFFRFFIIKFLFYHFHFFFWWSIKFLQQNIDHLETWINGLQI